MTYTRTTGFMLAELMYWQKPIFPVHTQIVNWMSVGWKDNVSREELLALQLKQLKQDNKNLKEAIKKLKTSRLKNKIYFDKKHRLRLQPIESGDWVLVYDSTFDTQYDARHKLTKHWFGPYVVVSVFETGTYKLREFDGSMLRNFIAGKRIKLFKRRESSKIELDEDFLEDEDEDEE
ncbi:hypothetical protein KP509_33G067400 [Ceratopteris richardii]|uniref:Uncharacterized protein n=1 Tax=Ceratopteris richardii TaxID=49495 RepID=A0A8T2QQQ0_CERRI|nr:hypothetical protein KP509_33G067400 [Ceratopteris richardii]